MYDSFTRKIIISTSTVHLVHCSLFTVMYTQNRTFAFTFLYNYLLDHKLVDSKLSVIEPVNYNSLALSFRNKTILPNTAREMSNNTAYEKQSK